MPPQTLLAARAAMDAGMMLADLRVDRKLGSGTHSIVFHGLNTRSGCVFFFFLVSFFFWCFSVQVRQETHFVLSAKKKKEKESKKKKKKEN
mgnify:CR=1 FL=1